MADQPRGKVDDTFLARLDDLKSLAGAQHDSVRGDGVLAWNIPRGWAGDPLDIPGMAAPYDRSAVGANAASLVADPANPGTSGSAIGTTIQSDFLGAAERAARARHMSPVRRALMAAARRAGHADDDGVLSRVEAAARGAIVAGESNTGDPPLVPAGGES